MNILFYKYRNYVYDFIIAYIPPIIFVYYFMIMKTNLFLINLFGVLFIGYLLYRYIKTNNRCITSIYLNSDKLNIEYINFVYKKTTITTDLSTNLKLHYGTAFVTTRYGIAKLEFWNNKNLIFTQYEVGSWNRQTMLRVTNEINELISAKSQHGESMR